MCYFTYQKKTLPDKFDLRDFYKIKAYNQGNSNSCSRQAITNQIHIILQELKVKIEPSRQFICFNSLLEDRDKEGSRRPLEDIGASLKSAYEALHKYKFCEEIYHPFDDKNILKFPDTNAYINAHQNNLITSYRYIYPSIYSFKYILAELKRPIVFGMAVYSAFENLNKDSYVLNKPSDNESYLGLHGVLAIGYDDTDQCMIVCNSHGCDWGLSGFFKMKYDYITDPNLCFEFWTINV